MSIYISRSIFSVLIVTSRSFSIQAYDELYPPTPYNFHLAQGTPVHSVPSFSHRLSVMYTLLFIFHIATSFLVFLRKSKKWYEGSVQTVQIQSKLVKRNYQLKVYLHFLMVWWTSAVFSFCFLFTGIDDAAQATEVANYRPDKFSSCEQMTNEFGSMK